MKRNGPPPRWKSAFTLVELLVVVLIVALLCLLAIPVMNGIASKGNVAKCANNLRQLGVGMAIYAGEHKGEWCYYDDKRENVKPLGTWIGRNIKEKDGSWNGLGKLHPYLRDKRLYICPADAGRIAGLKSRGDYHSETGTFSGNYNVRGYNQSYNPGTPNLKSLNTMGRRALVSCNFACVPTNLTNFPLSWHKGPYPVLFSDGSIEQARFPGDAVKTDPPPNINNSTSMQMRIWDYFDGKTTSLSL